jgi:hypothetical protein
MLLRDFSVIGNDTIGIEANAVIPDWDEVNATGLVYGAWIAANAGF